MRRRKSKSDYQQPGEVSWPKPDQVAHTVSDGRTLLITLRNGVKVTFVKMEAPGRFDTFITGGTLPQRHEANKDLTQFMAEFGAKEFGGNVSKYSFGSAFGIPNIN